MSQEVDLTSNPRKSFFNLSSPLVLFAVFSSFYTIIDTLWISGLGTDAVFAVGISNPIIALYAALGDSVGQGTNSIMSRYLGSDNYDNACNSFITGFFIIFAIYLIVLFTTTQFEWIVDMVDANSHMNLILTYLYPITVFSFFFIFSNFFSETMQAEGNSKLPAAVLIGSNILNLLLDPILIYNFNLGISGASYSSVIASGVCFVVLAYWYASLRTKIKFKRQYIKIRLYVIKEILKVSIPNSLEDVMSGFTSLFINFLLIGVVGPLGPAVFLVYDSLKKFCLSPIKGFGRGLLSVAGHLFGAKKFDEIKELYIYVLKLSLLASLIIAIIFLIFHQPIFDMFEMDDDLELIFELALGGLLLFTSSAITLISGKLLDGFAKSYYALLFNILKKVFQMILMVILVDVIYDDLAIFLPIIFAEVLFAFIYYIFTNRLILKSKVSYQNREVVESF